MILSAKFSADDSCQLEQFKKKIKLLEFNLAQSNNFDVN